MDNGFERYPAALGERTYPRLAAVVGVLVLAAGAYVVVLDLQKEEVLVAVGVGWLCLVLGLGGLGIGTMHTATQRRFRATRVRAADAGTPYAVDHQLWVASPRTLPVPLLITTALFTLGIVAVFAAGLLQLIGVMPRGNSNGTIGSLVTALLGTAFFGAVGGALTVANLRAVWYGNRLCPRPRGVLIGEHTVTLREKGSTITVPWQHVRQVVPITAEGHPATARIGLVLRRGSGLDGDMLAVPATGYGVPPDAVFTALRWYHAHPSERMELADRTARTRLDEWRRDAITARRRRTPRRPS
jgi:hypothetical protein